MSTVVRITTDSRSYEETVETNPLTFAQSVIINGYVLRARNADGGINVTVFPPNRIISVTYDIPAK